MPKPACIKCQCFYRVVKNDFAVIEAMPQGDAPNSEIRGLRRPEAWAPYKLWLGDKYRCPDCGHEIVVGWGRGPVAEHFNPGFDRLAEEWGATVTINDC